LPGPVIRKFDGPRVYRPGTFHFHFQASAIPPFPPLFMAPPRGRGDQMRMACLASGRHVARAFKAAARGGASKCISTTRQRGPGEVISVRNLAGEGPQIHVRRKAALPGARAAKNPGKKVFTHAVQPPDFHSRGLGCDLFSKFSHPLAASGVG